MDYKNIQELIKTMSESNLTSLEVETEGIRIKMEKKQEQVESKVVSIQPQKSIMDEVAVQSANQPNIQLNIENAQNGVSTTQKNSVTNSIIDEANVFIVKSPIVGTFYAASGPDKDDFAIIGKQVKKGDTLCILEAMKLMNEIESEVNGKVIEILVENEDMVEYGQPMFKILVEN